MVLPSRAGEVLPSAGAHSPPASPPQTRGVRRSRSAGSNAPSPAPAVPFSHTPQSGQRVAKSKAGQGLTAAGITAAGPLLLDGLEERVHPGAAPGLGRRACPQRAQRRRLHWVQQSATSTLLYSGIALDHPGETLQAADVAAGQNTADLTREKAAGWQVLGCPALVRADGSR